MPGLAIATKREVDGVMELAFVHGKLEEQVGDLSITSSTRRAGLSILLIMTTG